MLTHQRPALGGLPRAAQWIAAACLRGTVFILHTVRTGEKTTVALRKGTVPFSLRENRDSPPLVPSPVLNRDTNPSMLLRFASFQASQSMQGVLHPHVVDPGRGHVGPNPVATDPPPSSNRPNARPIPRRRSRSERPLTIARAGRTAMYSKRKCAPRIAQLPDGRKIRFTCPTEKLFNGKPEMIRSYWHRGFFQRAMEHA